MHLSFRIKNTVLLVVCIISVIVGSFTAAASSDNENKESKIGWMGMAMGATHSLAIKEDGTLWAWGGNGDGQLGLGNLSEEMAASPLQVKGIDNVVSVAAGGGFSLAIRKDGTVWSWGDNTDGQLGDGTVTRRATGSGEITENHNRSLPYQIKGLSHITAVAANFAASYALREDGILFGWGYISVPYRTTPGQFSEWDHVVAISAGYGGNLETLKDDGTVWEIGSDGHPFQIAGLTDITAIAAGSQYTYGLKSDGTVWFWGSNGMGSADGVSASDNSPSKRLEGIKDVISIQANAGGPLLLKKDGTVWTQGNNVGGQLGIGSYKDSDVPIQVKGLTKIIQIAAGTTAYRAMAIKEDHTLWSWGNGYVGDGTQWYRTAPVMIRSYASQILQDINTIKVELNGNELIFDQPPVLIKNRTMVPLRKIFESIGAQIKWDQSTATVTATKGDTIVKLTIGSLVGYVNDQKVSLDAAAVVLNDRTLVPVRFIASAFGAQTTWDDITKTVRIKTE